MSNLVCFNCHRTPEQIDEYVMMAEDEGITPDEFVRREEGTFNPNTGRFCCTECYIKIGQPSAPFPGWKAP